MNNYRVGTIAGNNTTEKKYMSDLEKNAYYPL
jgi:hypothetical protein